MEGKIDPTEELAPTPMLAGKYRLGRLLGEGGMGAVYEAEHVGLGSQVAIKLLGEGSNTDPKSIARFKREARAMGAIKHDNVVRVMDTGTDEYGLPYLVMELLDGEALSSVLRREKRLKSEVAVEIACQLLSGLAVAHERGVVHRDLKPGNVFIASQQDGTRRVKILDFGISKLHDSSTHNVTAEGALVGTPNFMAPEQITGESDSDIRIDVYAVGVLLYRMLCGRLPYVAKQADELYKKILAARPTRPRDLADDIPAELEALVLKAMAPDRDKRFADARSFEIALRTLYPTQEMFGAVSTSSGLQQLATLPRMPSASVPDASATVAAVPSAKRRQRNIHLHGWVRFRPWLIAAVIAAIAIGGIAIYQRSKSGAPAVASGYDGPAFRFGITRYLPTEMVETALNPLTRYLSDQLERNVELVVVDDFGRLANLLINGDVDMAALSSSTYVRAHARDPSLRPLVTPVRKGGNNDYEGYILVRSDSDINTLQDLRGKVFCYVSPTSTSGYLYPRALLRDNGIRPEEHFATTRFGGDHLGTLSALYNGACDGAAVYATIWHNGEEHGMPPQKFRPIATTDRIPDDAYVIAKTVDAGTAEAIKEALTQLKPGSPLARQVLVQPAKDSKQDIIGFEPASDDDYEPVRRYMSEENASRERGDAPEPYRDELEAPAPGMRTPDRRRPEGTPARQPR